MDNQDNARKQQTRNLMRKLGSNDMPEGSPQAKAEQIKKMTGFTKEQGFGGDEEESSEPSYSKRALDWLRSQFGGKTESDQEDGNQ